MAFGGPFANPEVLVVFRPLQIANLCYRPSAAVDIAAVKPILIFMIWIGTSGFQYPEWKGTFYPEKMSPAKMLPYYAARFSTTEINYSFYRIPSEKTLTNWAAATPAQFRFAMKAPQEITHVRKLRNCADVLERFAEC